MPGGDELRLGVDRGTVDPPVARRLRTRAGATAPSPRRPDKEASTMSDQSRDRIEGTADELKGRAKSAWGELADDDQARAEGEADQAKGEFKKGVADVKDKVDDAVKKVTDR
jgi:uncharacterized protein YjbJ (UPF0337 family)